MKKAIDLYYNLGVKYADDSEEMLERVSSFIEIGYNRIAILYESWESVANHDEIVETILEKYPEMDILILPRFHISGTIFSKRNDSVSRRDIFKIRSRAIRQRCIVSIEDTFFNKPLNPNDAPKFDIITFHGVGFKKLVKLLKKPVIFEFLVSKKTVNPKWLMKRLHLLKMLLDYHKLMVSSSSTPYTPIQLANFIYGIVGYNSFSYDVITTLPLKVVEKYLVPRLEG